MLQKFISHKTKNRGRNYLCSKCYSSVYVSKKTVSTYGYQSSVPKKHVSIKTSLRNRNTKSEQKLYQTGKKEVALLFCFI